MDEKQLKTAFAEALLRTPDDPFKAALSIFPDDKESTGKALQIATAWLRDPFVKQEQLRIIEDKGAKTFLPTKEDQAREVYKMATDSGVDEETRLKAHRLYAEIMGNIEKPAAANVTTNVNLQSVMVVRDHGSNEAWEQRALQSQRELVSHAAS